MKIDNIPSWVWWAIIIPTTSVILFFARARGADTSDPPQTSSLRDLGDLGSLELDSKNPAPVRHIIERLQSGELKVAEEGAMPICYLDDSLLKYKDNMDVFRSAYEHPGTRFALTGPEDTYVFHRTSFLSAQEIHVVKNSLVYDREKLKFALAPPITKERDMAHYMYWLVFSSILFIILMTICLSVKKGSGELWFESTSNGISDLGNLICAIILSIIMWRNMFFGLRVHHTAEVVFSAISALALLLWWVGSDTVYKKQLRWAGYTSYIMGGFSAGYVFFGEWFFG